MATMTLSQSSATASNANTPASAGIATVRDPRLDFYRGLAMFIILAAHTPGNFFTSWIPARWGFSDATEIFVFCSGMASAIAFGKVFAERSWFLGTSRVAFRVWQVYWAHICLFLVIAMAMAALNQSELFDKNYINSLNLARFFKDPAPQLIGLMTLTYVPNYFDILPMYLIILAMMPLIVALHRLHPAVAFGFMAVSWVFAQRSILEPIGLIDWHLGFPAEPWSERKWFFNPFGWQLVFFTGFAFMRGWLPRPPVHWMLATLAGIIVLANIPLSNIGIREFGFDWARDWRVSHRGLINKSDFGILRYVHFLSLAYLGWYVAGEGGKNLIPRGQDLLARIWQRLLTVILKVGQQSLAVFLASMLLARLIGVFFDVVGRTTLNVWIGNLTGFAILIAVAYCASWFKSQPWRRQRA